MKGKERSYNSTPGGNIMEKAIYIGNDTAGYYLKTKCIEYLEGKGIPYVDCGCRGCEGLNHLTSPVFLLEGLPKEEL